MPKVKIIKKAINEKKEKQKKNDEINIEEGGKIEGQSVGNNNSRRIHT